MQNNTQFSAIKWLKKELLLSLKQARKQLEAVQSNFDAAIVEKFEESIQALANNLEIANDDVGSILCAELSKSANFIRLNGRDKQELQSVDELMQGVVLVIDHIENLCHDLTVDSLPIKDFINSLRKQRGESTIQRSLLFGIDLSGVSIVIEKGTNDQKLVELAVETHPVYTQKLLQWFQNKDRVNALSDLADSFQALAEFSTTELTRLYFLSNVAIIESLLSGELSDENEIKRLVGRAEKQIKRLAEAGEVNLAKGLPLGLLRQSLYFVATLNSENKTVCELQETYALKSKLSFADDEAKSIHSIRAVGSLAVAIRSEFKKIRHWFEDIVEREKPPADEIDQFIQAAEGWSQTLSLAGEQELSFDMADFIRRLTFSVYGSDEVLEPQMLKLAEDWISIDAALKDIESDFDVDLEAHHEQDQQDRGEQDEEVSLVEATVKTTLEELQQIKEVITDTVDNESGVNWLEVRKLLDHVQAACHFIELEKLASLASSGRDFINAVIDDELYRVEEKDVLSLADIISTIEMALEDMLAGISVDTNPVDIAEIAANYLLARVDAIARGEVAGSPPKPQAVSLQLVDEGNDNDDEQEILEIFIEEAGEISQELKRDLAQWKNSLDNLDVMQDVRRAFHTLKGSGRLAKVEFLSETAWAIESLLNKLVEESKETSEETLTLVEYFSNCLPNWVDQISGQRPSLSDMDDIIVAAKAIESGVAVDLSFIKPKEKGSSVEGNMTVVADGGIEPEEDYFDQELYDIFSSEAATHLSSVQHYIDTHASHDTARVSERLFRALHTIEGSASMSHFAEIEKLTGVLCSFVRDLHESEVEYDMAIFGPILKDYLSITQLQVNSLGNVQHGEVHDSQALHDQIVQANTDLKQRLDGEADYYVFDEVEESTSPSVDSSDDETDETFAAGALDTVAWIESAKGKEQFEPLIDVDDKSDEQPNVNEESQEVDLLPVNEPVASKVEPEQKVEPAEMMAAQDDLDDSEMQSFFIEEGQELLDELSQCLNAWSEKVDDISPLDKILHVLHTLKGSSALVGFDDFASVVHEIESLLEKNQETKEVFTLALLKQLLDLSDALTVGLQDEALRNDANYYAKLLNKLKPFAQADKAELSPATAEEAVSLRVVGKVEGVRPVTPAAIIKPKKALNKGDDETVKISNKLLTRLIADVGEVNVRQSQLTEKHKERQFQLKELTLTIDRLRQQLRKLEIETEAQVLFKVDELSAKTEFDPLELDRYTQVQQISRSLLESISDLEVIREALLESDNELSQLLSKESKQTDTLLVDLLKTRMVDFGRFVPRFERLVRQVSGGLNKNVKLVVHGAETEIDRFILTELQASIEHIIRNALAHAIEPAEERLLAKKDETGLINIRLTREGSDIHLKISDDGRGLEVHKIRQKGIKLGLISENKQYSEHDLMQLILRPGFSTLDEVSKLAGRGIGMDIVNDTVRAIGGALTINSEIGKGASFHLVFPFTMAINMALMVEASGVTYAVPNNFVETVVRVPIDALRDTLKSDKPHLMNAGERYHMHNLSELLGEGSGTIMATESRWGYVLLVNSRQERYAVVVDQLLGNKEVVVKPLSLHMDLIPWLSGSTISSQGEVILLLDLPTLVELGKPNEQRFVEDKSNVKDEAPMIMVVDDSITFRKVATKLLRRAGYRVLEARDGLEAVEKLDEVTPDGFLLDVEMPRMDGFELARHIRRTAEIKDCPIVMVTSRTGEKHKNHAQEIGVNDYFGKPFDSAALIASINGLMGAAHAG